MTGQQFHSMAEELGDARVLALLTLLGKEGGCKYCPARVIWCTSKNGRPMAFDRNGLVHFATCPGASEARQQKGAPA